MSLAWSRRSVFTSPSIFSSARKFSAKTCRTTSRARDSSLISASFLETSRLTTASAIRPATSSRLGMSRIETTRSDRRVSSELAEKSTKSGLSAGQEHAEPRALAGQALDLDAAAVSVREPADEAQAQAKPGCGGRLRIGHAHIRIKDARERLGGNPNPVVFHGKLDHAGPVLSETGFHAHPATTGRILDGVGQEVLEHAVHRVSIGAECRDGGGARPVEMVAWVLGREDLDVGFDDAAQIKGHRAQLGSPSRFDPRVIQQISDDAAEALGFGVDVPKIFLGPFGRHLAGQQELAEPLERGQRRA